MITECYDNRFRSGLTAREWRLGSTLTLSEYLEGDVIMGRQTRQIFLVVRRMRPGISLCCYVMEVHRGPKRHRHDLIVAYALVSED